MEQNLLLHLVNSANSGNLLINHQLHVGTFQYICVFTILTFFQNGIIFESLHEDRISLFPIRHDTVLCASNVFFLTHEKN